MHPKMKKLAERHLKLKHVYGPDDARTKEALAEAAAFQDACPHKEQRPGVGGWMCARCHLPTKQQARATP